MGRLDRLMACMFLTALCLVGLGIADYLKLGDTKFVCFFGFIVTGISTLVLAFKERKGDDKEGEDDEG